MDITCPQCKSDKTVSGNVRGALPANFWLPWIGFRPDHLRIFTAVRRRLPLEHPFCACTQCGLVWSCLAADELARVVREGGRPELRRRLGF